MTYADRDEAYRAGREGRSIHTAYVDSYEEGQRDRKRARARAAERDGAGGGLGGLVLLAVALAAIAIIIGLAIVSAIAAFVAAFVVAAAARIPPRSTSNSYAEGYKASFYAFAASLAVACGLGFGAAEIQNGQPGAWYELVRETARAANEGGGYVLLLPLSWMPWPDNIVLPMPVAPSDLSTGALLVLLLPAWFAAIVALAVNTDFGFVRAGLAAPLVVAVGLAWVLSLIAGVLALAVRADIPPIEIGPDLAYVALLAAGAAFATAVVAGLVGGVALAAVTAAASLGKRFAAGASFRATLGAVFVSCVATAIGLFLFRHGDGFALTVRDAVSARQFALPIWPELQAFLPFSVPGVLLGGLFLRGSVPGSGFVAYLLACLLLTPLALAADAVALAGGFFAFDSGLFADWLR